MFAGYRAKYGGRYEIKWDFVGETLSGKEIVIVSVWVKFFNEYGNSGWKPIFTYMPNPNYLPARLCRNFHVFLLISITPSRQLHAQV